MSDKTMNKCPWAAHAYEPVDSEFLTLDMGLDIDTKDRQVRQILEWTGITGNILPGKPLVELTANEVAAIHLVAHLSFRSGVKSVRPIDIILKIWRKEDKQNTCCKTIRM